MKVDNKFEIIFALKGSESSLRSFGVSRLGLFGSFVRNEQNEKSDIDFLVEFEPGKKTYDNFIELAFYLEELLERKVELLTPQSMSPYIKPHILKEVEYVTIAA